MTPDEIKKTFIYKNNDLYWRNCLNNGTDISKPAGTIDDSYRRIRYAGKPYRAARLIYTLHNGVIKDGYVIDHIDGDKLNNTISNLRMVTQQVNCKNRLPNKNSTTGVSGVYWYKQTNKWKAQISLSGKNMSLGYFLKKSDAIKARKSAELEFNYI